MFSPNHADNKIPFLCSLYAVVIWVEWAGEIPEGRGVLLDLVMAGATVATVLEVGGAEEAVTELTKGTLVRGFPSDLVRAGLPSHFRPRREPHVRAAVLTPATARSHLAVADLERRMPVVGEVTNAGRELFHCV